MFVYHQRGFVSKKNLAAITEKVMTDMTGIGDVMHPVAIQILFGDGAKQARIVMGGANQLLLGDVVIPSVIVIERAIGNLVVMLPMLNRILN